MNKPTSIRREEQGSARSQPSAEKGTHSPSSPDPQRSGGGREPDASDLFEALEAGLVEGSPTLALQAGRIWVDGETAFDASAVLRAIPRLPPAWRPIATAPRTGEHIVVADFTPHAGGFGHCGNPPTKQPWMDVAHWYGDAHAPQDDGFYASSYGGDQAAPFLRLTHWMPLPPAPETPPSVTTASRSEQSAGSERSEAPGDDNAL
jgi:hypothetical protein